MIRLILSTSNITSAVPSIIRKLGSDQSNLELLALLQSNFQAARSRLLPSESTDNDPERTHGKHPCHPHVPEWTTRDGSNFYIPTIDWSKSGLLEERSQYEITVKMFYLQKADLENRAEYTDQAVQMVLKELGIDYIDLLIVAFPGTQSEVDYGLEEDDAEQVGTWEILEGLYKQGIVKKLGVADFFCDQLARFLTKVKIWPRVDQLKVKHCCTVQPKLLKLAKLEKIELLTHHDSSDILPCKLLYGLLGNGEKGAGVLPGSGSTLDDIKNKIAPKWVVKYTAIVRERGVIESKGYFAVVELTE